MTPEQLKASIIQSALEGKITQQRSEDTPVAETLNRIQELRNAMIKRKEIKKVKVLPIDDTVPFDIPDSWKWVRIGAIEEINLGFTYRPEYTDKGVYFLSVKDISGGKIDFQNAKKVSQETYDNAAYGSKPRKGDILFGRVGTMGKPQIIDTDEPFCIFVSLGFFRDHTNIVVKEYISLWMQSVLFNKQVDENVKGSAQRNLNTGWLKDFYIPFPPIEEQHRIVDKIEELLPYVDRYAEAYEKLEQFNAKFPEDMKKSILQYAFEGKLVEQIPSETPSISIVNDIRAEQERLIKTKEIKREKIDTSIQYEEELPDGWCVAKLGELTRVVTKQTGFDYSKTIKPNLIEYKAENTIPLVQTKNFKGKTFNLDTDYYIPIDIAKEFPKILLDGKCLLLSIVGASIGNVGLYELEELGMIGGAICKVQLINDLFYDYLFYYLQSPLGQNEIRKNFKATAQGTITVQDVREIIVKIPPLEEQHRIVSKIEELLPFCDQLIK